MNCRSLLSIKMSIKMSIKTLIRYLLRLACVDVICQKSIQGGLHASHFLTLMREFMTLMREFMTLMSECMRLL